MFSPILVVMRGRTIIWEFGRAGNYLQTRRKARDSVRKVIVFGLSALLDEEAHT